jgi:hypothetical protein
MVPAPPTAMMRTSVPSDEMNRVLRHLAARPGEDRLLDDP